MIIITLLILLTVVALPSLNVSSVTATRVCVLVLASTSIVSYNASPSGAGTFLYGGLMQVTSTSYIVDVLLGLVGAAALTPWAPL
jgi:hypothetical protein